MKKKDSRLIIIDASVAHSAGETKHPVSMSCRDALINILKICHHIVITKAIREEYKIHVKRFFRKWLNSMYARKKINNFKDVNLPEVAIKQINISSHDKAALEKDFPIIRAACAGDGIIITTDKKIIKIFSKYKEKFKLPKTIRWINPLCNNLECLKDL